MLSIKYVPHTETQKNFCIFFCPTALSSNLKIYEIFIKFKLFDKIEFIQMRTKKNNDFIIDTSFLKAL